MSIPKIPFEKDSDFQIFTQASLNNLREYDKVYSQKRNEMPHQNQPWIAELVSKSKKKFFLSSFIKIFS